LTPFLPEITTRVLSSAKAWLQLIFELSRLLDISRKDLISRTIEYTVPHFVYHRDPDILKEIGNILGQSLSDLHVKYMHNILAYHFMLDDDVRPSGEVLRGLIEVDDDDISLVKRCGLYLVVELAIELGDQKQKVRLSIQRDLGVVLRIVTRLTRQKRLFARLKKFWNLPIPSRHWDCPCSSRSTFVASSLI
jgi:hypothetical protein